MSCLWAKSRAARHVDNGVRCPPGVEARSNVVSQLEGCHQERKSSRHGMIFTLAANRSARVPVGV